MTVICTVELLRLPPPPPGIVLVVVAAAAAAAAKPFSIRLMNEESQSSTGMTVGWEGLSIPQRCLRAFIVIA